MTTDNATLLQETMHNLRGAGYASEARAKAQLERYAGMFAGHMCLVAVQGGRFYPVVIYNASLGGLNFVALALRGLHIVT